MPQEEDDVTVVADNIARLRKKEAAAKHKPRGPLARSLAAIKGMDEDEVLWHLQELTDDELRELNVREGRLVGVGYR